MVTFPELTRELEAGLNRDKAIRRRDALRHLMRIKPSTWYTVMHRFIRGSRTWFYGCGADPILVEPPTGDIRVRTEVALVFQELERNYPGRLLGIYISIDYNCELFVKAVPTTTGTLLVIRLDGREKSAKEEIDVLYNVMEPWLVPNFQ